MNKKKSYEKKLRIVFTGGGTGGHIFPGLAVAYELQKSNQNLEIFWIGNKTDADKTLVEESFEGKVSIKKFYGVHSGKLRRYFSLKNFFDFFKILLSCVENFFLLLRIKPALVFSKGGFVSVPPCFCAFLLRIPVITHECDFTPGLATKINSNFAKMILLSYDETQKFFQKKTQKTKKQIKITGNPVRHSFYDANPAKAREFLNLPLNSNENNENKKPILLILGGSLGAHEINNLIDENLPWLLENFTVIHQRGKTDFLQNQNNKNEQDAKNSKKLQNYLEFSFIRDQICDILSLSDIVISRAGSNALWEIATLKKPSILIPLCKNGSRGDQIENANYFLQKNAAFVLQGENANSKNLKSLLLKMKDENFRKILSENCGKIVQNKKPSEKIAKIILDFLNEIENSFVRRKK